MQAAIQPIENKLFARYEHGGFTVIDKGGEYVLQRPDGLRVFQTSRQLLADLTGHPTGRNWTWDRYFRLNKYQTPSARAEALGGVSVFDLFAPEKPASFKSKTAIGIDLNKRGIEVKKLLFAGFGGKIKSAGYDPDEVLQEVYKGILVRNNGKCPFDPAKASFGHYVHMVCDCIVSNYHRKMSRQRRVEPIADESDELAMENAEGVSSAESDQMVTDDLISALTPDSPWDTGESLMVRVIPYVRAGYGRSEIAEALKVPKAAVSKALNELRQEAAIWAR